MVAPRYKNTFFQPSIFLLKVSLAMPECSDLIDLILIKQVVT